MIKKTYLTLIFLFLFTIADLFATNNISGIVTEQKSGEVVIGASVALYKDSLWIGTKPLRGSLTNKFGFFSIPKINIEKFYIVVRSVGYEPYIIFCNLENKKDIEYKIELITKDIKTQTVTVTADRESAPVNRISSIEIKPDFVLKMPSLGGESDVFRTLQLLPGVKQASELSSGLYVRGGSPDQNLTLLDGVIVYNPSHLGGFLSSFNSDALRDIKLIKGAFPAEYGGRISSVLDLTMKEGSKDQIHGQGGISLIASRLTLEGPIGQDITYMISGRRMYLDLLLALSPDADDAPNYYFYDLNAKINYKISDKDRVFLSAYFGRDVLSSPNETRNNNEFNILWGNSTFNSRWMHIFSSDLFSNFSFIYTDYNFSTELNGDSSSNSNFSTKSQIKDITFKGDIQYFYNENHKIKSGIEITNHNFTTGSYTNLIEDPEDLKRLGLLDQNKNAFEIGMYVQDEWQISDELTSNLGTRLFYFDKGNYLNFEPRLSASYKITDDLSLNSSFAIANQFLHLIVRNDINLPTDLWFPSTETIKPAKSYQTVLGLEKTFLDGEYLVTLEGYYKSMDNLYEYKDSASFSLGTPLETQFTKGKGNAYGLELFINKRVGALTGWIGYTMAWTKRQFDELNNGKEFYPRYDRRHDFSLALTYEIGKKWELGLTWVYGTGQAFTVPTGTYVFENIGDWNMNNPSNPNDPYNPKYNNTDRNAFRLPSFHKLDLNFMHKFEWFGLPFQFSINIYNAYNRRNPFIWYIDNEIVDGIYTNKKVIKQFTLFPIIPTFGLSFKF